MFITLMNVICDQMIGHLDIQYSSTLVTVTCRNSLLSGSDSGSQRSMPQSPPNPYAG